MAGKPKKPAAPVAENYPRKAVQVLLQQGDSEELVAWKTTAVMITPEMAAFRVIRGAEQKAGNWEGMDVPALMDQLRDQAAAVNRGDLAQAEAMLMNQATALQSLFARLAERGMGCDMAPAFEANMRMALRAQSQCRATLETLATIKNPPIVYAKQANFAAGHQQVNNGIPAPAQAREIESEQSQLSGVTNELLSDARASGIESRANPALETVGEVNRAKIGRG
ncbi:MAG: hypothetical protein Q8K12_14070 [Thiobacillus sp.]|nr:hypothetical protein [Thiobacillus sp.]